MKHRTVLLNIARGNRATTVYRRMLC